MSSSFSFSDATKYLSELEKTSSFLQDDALIQSASSLDQAHLNLLKAETILSLTDMLLHLDGRELEATILDPRQKDVQRAFIRLQRQDPHSQRVFPQLSHSNLDTAAASRIIKHSLPKQHKTSHKST
ncbi:uncharacterized protein MONOS_18196 [Monocercomonoides exilis]|uniref:uncharacterized protein n=1 Tax=Monocercomonoides exilis TaxID=2049356 RepID=UPI0035596080|nr:hypothetical protein MONOS_18196 [Monocercomonoides exilis]